MAPVVALLPERKRQFTKPSLHPIRFDVREVLAIHTRCTLVGAALGIGMRQDVQGRRAEGHDLLAPVYGWFTEGFDTADLIEAKTLLAELT